jgi:hypothetical protein
MYPPTSSLIALGRFGIVLLVGLSYPLQLMPCRACVYAFTSGIIKGKKDLPLVPEDASVNVPFIEPGQEEEEEEEDDPLMPKRYVNDRGIGTGEMRRSKFVGFTTGILVVGFLIALVVDELEVGELQLSSLPDCAKMDVSHNAGRRADTPTSQVFEVYHSAYS